MALQISQVANVPTVSVQGSGQAKCWPWFLVTMKYLRLVSACFCAGGLWSLRFLWPLLLVSVFPIFPLDLHRPYCNLATSSWLSWSWRGLHLVVSFFCFQPLNCYQVTQSSLPQKTLKLLPLSNSFFNVLSINIFFFE